MKETKTVQVAWQRDSLHNDGLKYLSFIAWQPGGLGWVTVNTDDNVNSHGGGYASVFRNHFGRWLGGFTLVLGRCDLLEVELWGIYSALRLA